MKKIIPLVFIFFFISCGDSVKQKEYISPDVLYPQLFKDIQQSAIFPSSKIFADAIPKGNPETINKAYENEKSKAGFNLKAFTEKNFEINRLNSDTLIQEKNFDSFLQKNLLKLVRKPKDDGGSLIPTRTEYLSGGNEVNEFNYFTSFSNYLALKKINKSDLAIGQIANCAQFIESFGHVPFGNRSYYLERSSMPVFGLMLNEENDDELLKKYLPQLNREYQYWMSVEDKEDQKTIQDNLKKGIMAYKSSIYVDSSNVLNRYYDPRNQPRTEKYREDLNESGKKVYWNNLRLSETSNWPEYSRWLMNPKLPKSLNISSILPVDLNAILYIYEKTLSKAYKLKEKPDYAQAFENLAQKRKKIFNQYFWNEKEGFYCDYDFVNKVKRNNTTLAGLIPLLTDLPTKEQKIKMLEYLKKHFESSKGLKLTPNHDLLSPEWFLISILALNNAGETQYANKIRKQFFNYHKEQFDKGSFDLQKNKTPSGRLDGFMGTLIILTNNL